jgi:sugar phosphate isomerase/epimerase
MMYKGIFSKTFATANVDDNFRTLKSLGYEATQFNFASAGLPSLPAAIADEKIEEIAAAARKHGVKIEAISATFNMTHPDQTVIDNGMVSLTVICEAAARLNCPLVTLCTGTLDAEDQWRFHPDNNTPQAWQKIGETMTHALQIASKYGVSLGIEPELANIVNSAEKARQLIDEMNSDALKVIFDPANLFEVATIIEQHHIVKRALDLLAGDIAIAHAKDRNTDGSFATAGKGVLDYHFYLKQLKASGFDGCIITHGLADSEAQDVSRMLDKHLHIL